MAETTARAIIAVDARRTRTGARQYKKAIKQDIEQPTKEASKSMGEFSKIAKNAFKAAVIIKGLMLIRDQMTGMVAAAIDAEEKFAQLRAGLESTNSVSGQTVQSIDDMARALQESTRYSDDAIKEIAGIALSFTNIRDEVFPGFLAISADVATRMGTDLKGTAVQLAKALNDPVANLGLLSRAGIQFEQSQKDVIRTLWESNKRLEAQSIIMSELERQYGGSAEAAKDTLGGAIDGLKNAFADLQEALGSGAAPAIKDAAIWATEVVEGATALWEDFTSADVIRGQEQLIALEKKRLELRKELAGIKPPDWGTGSGVETPEAGRGAAVESLMEMTDALARQKAQLELTSDEFKIYEAIIKADKIVTDSLAKATKDFNLTALQAKDVELELVATKEVVIEAMRAELDAINKLTQEQERARNIKKLNEDRNQFLASLEQMTTGYEREREMLGMSGAELEKYRVRMQTMDQVNQMVDRSAKEYNLTLDDQIKLRAILKADAEAGLNVIYSEIDALEDAKLANKAYLDELQKYNKAKADMESFGRSLGGVFADIVLDSKNAGEAIEDFIKMLIRMKIQQAFASGFGGFAGTPPVAGADGLVAFGSGGVVDRATPAVIGERGAEAVLPLSRGSDGKLGVRMDGRGGGGKPITQNINIQTIDAKSFMDQITQPRVARALRGVMQQQNIRGM